MTDEPTNWVTVKVPEGDRDKAKEYRPDGATFGDCLVAGAERLNGHLDSDPPVPLDDGPAFEAAAEITPTVNEDALEELKQEIEDAASGATIDEDAIARAVSKQLDYAMLADKVAEEVAGRLR